MKIAERYTNLLRAVHALNLPSFKAGDLTHRVAGKARRDHEPLYEALVGCLGPKIHTKGVGILLQKVAGKWFGDFRLDGDYSTSRELWTYAVITREQDIPCPADSTPVNREARSFKELDKFEEEQVQAAEEHQPRNRSCRASRRA